MSERKVNPETLDFLIGYLQDAPEQQEVHSEAISTRAGQLLAAGTVLLGLTATAATELNSALVGLSVVTYVASAVFAFLAIHHRPMRVSRQANELWRLLCDQPPEDAKHSIMADISDGYAENTRTLKTKHRWARLVLVATGVQAVFVGTALFISLV